MTIQTIPVFYYVNGITKDNNLLNFVEPLISASELTATLAVGSRSMTDLMTEVARALTDAGANDYTAVFDRDTRIVTISADSDFDLLVLSGSNLGLSAYGLIGFTGSDQTGGATYDGDGAMGSTYSPQFKPQSFKSFDNNNEGILSSVNESASGVLEVVTFGDRRFMEMNLTFITDRLRAKGGPIRNSQTAVADIRAFLEFLIGKSNLEFMPSESDLATFNKVILESTRKSKQGTSYELRELISRNLEDYYETGILKFRKVTT